MVCLATATIAEFRPFIKTSLMPSQKPYASRSTVIDLCRGLLFVLMTNTHALSLAGVSRSSWLFSDIWLPNGWATVAFVVLSGYGVGYVYSVRKPVEARNAALRRRSVDIFIVMVVSNVLFALLRQVANHDLSVIMEPTWWLGFVTLESPWTISGILLPTCLVLLTGPFLIPRIQISPLRMLVLLLLARLVISLFTILARSSNTSGWIVKLLLLDGLGGFPVLSFTINGCIGIWLGIMHHRNTKVWWFSIGILILFQVLAYILSHIPSQPASLFISIFGGVGKFAWMLVVAYVMLATPIARYAEPISTIGRFSLGSFIAHRVFLQGIVLGISLLGFMKTTSPEVRYVVMLVGALALTWLLCIIRQRIPVIDRTLRSAAL